jgi:hypothetical protein
VVRALSGHAADQRPFGAPAGVAEMADAVSRLLGVAPHPVEGGLVAGADPRLAPLAFAHGWVVDGGSEEGPEKAVIRPLTP